MSKQTERHDYEPTPMDLAEMRAAFAQFDLEEAIKAQKQLTNGERK